MLFEKILEVLKAKTHGARRPDWPSGTYLYYEPACKMRVRATGEEHQIPAVLVKFTPPDGHRVWHDNAMEQHLNDWQLLELPN